MAGVVATAEVRVDAPLERVWGALVDPDDVKAWMFGTTLTTDWVPGHPISWSGEYEGTAYRDSGEVLEVDRPTTLSVTHYSPLSGRPDTPENHHTLTWRLAGDAEGTTLSLSQDGNADAEEAEHSRANWAQALSLLKAHVEGR
ncbi:MAG: SRPBCC domain-containing protein [Propionicimonas sp.]|uniref:SRPBCC family protein n=1 Tax=Propionicimonas sp. TaxID=1955623 RepID=UPI003D0FC7C6